MGQFAISLAHVLIAQVMQVARTSATVTIQFLRVTPAIPTPLVRTSVAAFSASANCFVQYAWAAVAGMRHAALQKKRPQPPDAPTQASRATTSPISAHSMQSSHAACAVELDVAKVALCVATVRMCVVLQSRTALLYTELQSMTALSYLVIAS